MRDFRQLKVWEKAHLLTLSIYRASVAFPREEQYGLTSQLRRAAASIPANIAEDCGRDTDAQLARFLQISMGSASELEYHLILAKDLGLLPEAEFDELAGNIREVKMMLTGFLKTLRADR